MNASHQYYQRVIGLRWLLLISTLMLIIGLFLPMLSITQFMFIRSDFSVINGIGQLWKAHHFVLAFIITGFSLCLPFAKLIVLFRLLQSHKPSPHKNIKLLHLMHDYGRWAMLDVMVVAMLIVSVKLGAIASIQIHIGLYIFGCAVLLIMLLTQRTAKLIETQH